MSAPNLRFPGFAGEWEEKPLGDIASFSKGKGISKADISASGATPCIRYGELYTHYGTRIDEVLSATDVPVSELKLSQGGEVIVPASGEDARDIATAAVVLRRGVALGGDLNIIRSASDGFFLASYIAGKKRLTLAAMAQGNSVVHLYPAQLGSLALSFPTLPEQQKIAAFLGAVDAKLAALAAKQAALGRFKAGLMQKLFSQQLRFTRDDGTDFPDWEEKRLGDFCEALSGYPVSGDDILETETETRLMRGANISEGAIRRSADLDRFLGGNVRGLERFLLEVGDVVIGMDGSKVGKNVATIDPRDAGSFLIQRVTRLRNDGRNDLRFVYHQVTSPRFRQYVDVVNTSSGIPHISLKQIRDFEIPMPHPDEQQKIADALSAMDAKIQAVEDQVTKLQTFKKGLLQQMFL